MSHNVEDAMKNPFRIKAVADRLWKQCALGLFVMDMRDPEPLNRETNLRYVHACTVEDPSGVVLTMTKNHITDLAGIQGNRIALSISSQETADVDPETLMGWVRAILGREAEKGVMLTHSTLNLPPHEGQTDPRILHQYNLHYDEDWVPIMPPPIGVA